MVEDILQHLLNQIYRTEGEINELKSEKAIKLKELLSYKQISLRDKICAWMQYGNFQGPDYFTCTLRDQCPLTYAYLEDCEQTRYQIYNLFTHYNFEDLLSRFYEDEQTEEDLAILEEWMNANINSYKYDW